MLGAPHRPSGPQTQRRGPKPAELWAKPRSRPSAAIALQQGTPNGTNLVMWGAAPPLPALSPSIHALSGLPAALPRRESERPAIQVLRSPTELLTSGWRAVRVPLTQGPSAGDSAAALSARPALQQHVHSSAPLAWSANTLLVGGKTASAGAAGFRCAAALERFERGSRATDSARDPTVAPQPRARGRREERGERPPAAGPSSETMSSQRSGRFISAPKS